MIIKNVKKYTENCNFEDAEIYIEGERFAGSVTEDASEPVIDGEGAYALPGLIDLHFHGCIGADFCDGSREALEKISAYEASVGVTTIAPATMTLPTAELEQILANAAEYRKNPAPGADIVGINMEGPFISPAKKGAQDERNIISCDVDICRRFLKASEGLVKFIGIAPEESEDAVSFIKEVKDEVHVSLAHTNADYDTALAAFRAGADHAVHLYNAMPPFTHRAPGVVGAVADCDHVCEAGEIRVDGIEGPVINHSTQEAQQKGIATVYQEVNLCPNLTVAENLFIGREPRNALGLIQWKKMNKMAQKIVDDLNIDIDVTVTLENYSVALQQMVAIARAVDMDSKVLILDEPTSSLDDSEVEKLFKMMLRLKKEGGAEYEPLSVDVNLSNT